MRSAFRESSVAIAETLDPTRNEPQRLQEALRLNQPLAIVYYLKEELNELWEQEDQETAQSLLMDWITYAETAGIAMLTTFARTLRLHARRILAWYDHPISTGPLKGANNKIKTMKRHECSDCGLASSLTESRGA